jgi:hypothetical protein
VAVGDKGGRHVPGVDPHDWGATGPCDSHQGVASE